MCVRLTVGGRFADAVRTADALPGVVPTTALDRTVGVVCRFAGGATPEPEPVGSSGATTAAGRIDGVDAAAGFFTGVRFIHVLRPNGKAGSSWRPTTGAGVGVDTAVTAAEALPFALIATGATSDAVTG